MRGTTLVDRAPEAERTALDLWEGRMGARAKHHLGVTPVRSYGETAAELERREALAEGRPQRKPLSLERVRQIEERALRKLRARLEAMGIGAEGV